jgi:hypothetical protein
MRAVLWRATMTDVAVPQPKFKLGQKVFYATTHRTTEKGPCPDCAGEKYWTVTTPTGTVFKTPCQRCQGYTASLDGIPTVVGLVGEFVIKSLDIKMEQGGGFTITYYNSPGCCGNVRRETELHEIWESAEAVSKILAAEETAKIQKDLEAQIAHTRAVNRMTYQDAERARLERELFDSRSKNSDLKEAIKNIVEELPGNIKRSQAEEIVEWILAA